MLLHPSVSTGAGAGALAITLYTVALLYTRKFWRENNSQHDHWIHIIIAFGLVMHTFSISSLIWQSERINAGLFAMISTGSAATIAIVISANYWRPALSVLTPILLIVALICVPTSHIFETYAPLQGNNTLAQTSHILLSITAWATLIVAFGQSIMASIQSKALKKHQTNTLIERLPPLQTTEKVLFELLTLGWCLLTLSLVTGLIAFDDFFGQRLAHKTFFSILAWLLLAIVLLGHWVAGWRGQQTLRLTRWGVALMILGYLGSKIAVEIIFT